MRTSRTKASENARLRGGTVLALAWGCLFLSISPGTSLAAERAQSVRSGDALPIYLQPETLAEANKPGADLVNGNGFWFPGPERFYGWALQDLRDYLQKATRAQHPLIAADAKAASGIFVGTFAQFPSFRPAHADSQRAVASADPEAFVVEVQGDKLFVLGNFKSHDQNCDLEYRVAAGVLPPELVHRPFFSITSISS